MKRGGGLEAAPSNSEAEAACLAACLLNKDAWVVLKEYCPTSEYFTQPDNVLVYRALEQVDADDMAFDSVTVCTKLGEINGTGNFPAMATYVAGLTESLPTSANIEHYANIVRKLYMLRCAMMECQRMLSEAVAFEGTADEFVASAMQRFERIGARSKLIEIKAPDDLIVQHFDWLNGAKTNALKTIPSGIVEIDRFWPGLVDEELVLVCARPSVGKTSFMCTLAYEWCKTDHPGIIVTVETSAKMLHRRMNQIVCPIDRYEDACRNHGKFALMTQYAQRCFDLPLWYLDRRVLIEDIIVALKKHVAKHPGTRWIAIDYMQRIQTRERFRNDVDKLNYILEHIDKFRRETQIPVLLLSQLRRFDQKNIRPTLEEIKGTGALEESADVALLLFDPEYDPATDDQRNAIDMQVIVAKNRDGRRGTVSVRFLRQQTRYVSILNPPQEQAPQQNSWGFETQPEHQPEEEWAI